MKSKSLLTLIGGICLILVLAALPFMAACPAPPPPPEEEEEAPPPEEVKTLKIGATVPFGTPIGLGAKEYFEVLIPKFNEAGGLVVKGQRYNIDYVIYDDKYTADAGRAAVERLVYQDKVRHMVGQIGSAPTVAGLPITEKEKVLVIANCASDKLIIGNRYTARAGASLTDFPPGCLGLLKVYPNVKTAVTLGPDDETGHFMTEVMVTIYEGLGLKVLETLYYPRDMMDFAPIATKIASLNPDVVELRTGGLGGTQEGLQIQALYDVGYKGLIFAFMDSFGEIKSVASNEALEGALTYIIPTNLPTPPPVAAELVDAYVEKYGKWDCKGVKYFGPWYMFVAAVEKADSLDIDDILAALEGLEYDSAMGHMIVIKRPDLGVDRFCDVAKSIIIGEVRDGQKVWIETVSAQENVELAETIWGFPGEWR